MNFDTTLPALAALCTRLTGLYTSQRDMPQKVTNGKTKGKLVYKVTSCIPNGLNDDIRYVFDAGTGLFTMTVFGLRTFTLSVRFEGFDHTPANDALFYLSRLATRLSYPSSLDALHALDMTLVKRLGFTDLSNILSAEDRQWSIGNQDFLFQCVVSDTPTDGDDNPASWIEQVHYVSNTLDGEDGLPLAAPLQIDDTVTRG